MEEIRPGSLADKWKSDMEGYYKKPNPLTPNQQCDLCVNRIRGSVSCKYYEPKDRPADVLVCRKECAGFSAIRPLAVPADTTEKKRYYGGLLGLIVGDFLGVPVEFSSREKRKADPVKEMRAYGTYYQGFGTWSDDSSLMLCLASALKDGYSHKKLAANMVSYWKEGAFTPDGTVFDIGNATKDAIEKMERGIDPVACGGTGENSCGNGSLMRILPAAFAYAGKPASEWIPFVEQVSSLTHAHPACRFACIFYVAMVQALFAGKGKKEAYAEAIRTCVDLPQDPYGKERVRFLRLLKGKIDETPENEIRSTGYVLDTLEAAVWALLTTDTYEDAVFACINLGEDTDTVAAVCGGLAGTLYGVDAIRKEWLDTMKRGEEILALLA